ncbi:septin interacting protein 1 [Rhodnius prolixus]|uniref:septin interacting protein 1 n=1 Tax=Rhodnius prolixus TaxID=13249 RepID=UPI003D189292
MSDEEYEAFEVTDYDLENEFNINRRRRTTKNQQIYGIWSRDSDDDEGEGRPSFKSGSRKAKNLSSAPIGFVSGGVQQAGQPQEKKEEGDDEEDEDGGDILIQAGSSSSDDEKEPRMAFKLDSLLNTGAEEIAGLRKKHYQHNSVLSNKGVGTWEKHTKGIGAKLLLQMGFQPGKGLGKDLQGIQAPIEAKLRKGRGAIGAYGPEKSQKVAEVKPEPQKIKEGIEKISLWKKGEHGRNKKAKYIYKSIEDVLDQSWQPQRKREFNELSKVKVIDMTGPEQRVLSGYHAISGNQKPSDEWDLRKDKKFKNFEMPELLHNLNLLVEMCEQDIIAKDRQLRYNEDRIVSLKNDRDTMQKVVDQEEATISSLEHVLNVLDSLTQGSKDGRMSLDDIANAYQQLQTNHPTEYIMYNLAGLAPGILKPLLKKELEQWSPLVDARGPLDLILKWAGLLASAQGATLAAVACGTQATLADPLHRILWEVWAPEIIKCVGNWNAKDPVPMQTLFETWESVVPKWILDNLLQQQVMAKLQETVEQWNPLTDTIPIHTWVLPWMPQLGKRIRVSVLPVIRQKLATALTGWHPSDSSARYMLQPWANVFTPQEMDTFLVNNIMPKLAQALGQMYISHQNLNLDAWKWVMEWNELVRPPLMADLLDQHFFPKWLQVLTVWLNTCPNYDQVMAWYSGWKSVIPPHLLEEQRVKDQLRNALELMSRSVGGPVLPPPPPPPPPPDISSGRFQGMAEAVRTATQMVEGYKDLVQKRCEERGVVFHPLPNRYKEGKQVYRCGAVQMYIDRNVIFNCDHNTGNWIPISLQALLEKAAGIG